MLANSGEGLATEFANSPNSLGLCVRGAFFSAPKLLQVAMERLS